MRLRYNTINCYANLACPVGSCTLRVYTCIESVMYLCWWSLWPTLLLLPPSFCSQQHWHGSVWVRGLVGAVTHEVEIPYDSSRQYMCQVQHILWYNILSSLLLKTCIQMTVMHVWESKRVQQPTCHRFPSPPWPPVLSGIAHYCQPHFTTTDQF